MQCILCHLSFSVVSELKQHYVDFHGVDKANSDFLDLFQPDTLDRKCKKCCMMLSSNRMKKNHKFLYHYSQAGSARNRLNDLPLNILRGHRLSIILLILTSTETITIFLLLI